MYSLMGVPLGVATATSNFMVGITAAVSASLYYGRGDIYPFVAVPTAIGVFTGAMLGRGWGAGCGSTCCGWAAHRSAVRDHCRTDGVEGHFRRVAGWSTR